jgi:hypothetical protein
VPYLVVTGGHSVGKDHDRRSVTDRDVRSVIVGGQPQDISGSANGPLHLQVVVAADLS